MRVLLSGSVSDVPCEMVCMGTVTQILSSIEQGDPKAAEQLLPLVYEELRKLAAQKMVQEAVGLIVGHDKQFKLSAQRGVTAARVVEKRRTLLERFLYCGGKELFLVPGKHRNPH